MDVPGTVVKSEASKVARKRSRAGPWRKENCTVMESAKGQSGAMSTARKEGEERGGWWGRVPVSARCRR